MKGQTVVEYVIVLGIIVMVLYTMGPTFKRGVQSIIKGTADQLAAQKNSDQDFTDTGSHMDLSQTNAVTNNQRSTAELWGISTTAVNESMETTTNTLTNGGFTAQ